MNETLYPVAVETVPKLGALELWEICLLSKG